MLDSACAEPLLAGPKDRCEARMQMDYSGP